MYEDKTLVCKECGNEFVFTAGEQEFYAEKGFVNEPQRCKACRDALPVHPDIWSHRQYPGIEGEPLDIPILDIDYRDVFLLTTLLQEITPGLSSTE